MYLTQVRHTIR